MIKKSTRKDFACIILAAGKSTRFGSDKLFTSLGKGPMLYAIVDKISAFRIVDKILIVTSDSSIAMLKRRYANYKQVQVVLGGRHRTESTLLGLLALRQTQYKYVYIHDGARPVIYREDFVKLKNKLLAHNYDGVISCVEIYDSLLIFNRNINKSKHLKKNTVVAMKTPHLYKLSAITEALSECGPDIAKKENVEIMTTHGKKVGCVTGTIGNLKVTRRDDKKIIKKILS